jgi:4'-phosphopantetheinyl transferase
MLALSNSEIHVWALRLTASEMDSDPLSEDEHARAARFRFEKDRRKFQLCRTTLRVLLGEYLNQPAERLCFTYGPRGKPQLAADGGGLRFNVSHSRDMALFAFAQGLEIGVDVEGDRPLSDMADIARRFFCAEEHRQLMSMAEDERKRGFFRCWTRKEAYLKATGDGLHAPLDGFQVSFETEDSAHFVHINGSPEEASQWTLHSITMNAGFTGALAYRGKDRTVLMKEITHLR